MKNQKGMELAIQIFIVLFVLLAVAMLVLRMLSGQITQQSSEMQKEQTKMRLQQAMQDMRNKCITLCNQAMQDGSLRSKAQFCMEKFSVDITGDSLTNAYDEKLLSGVGVCEDAIYCPLIVECDAGTKLTMKNCINILCQYWERSGMDSTQATANLNKFITPGSCYNNQESHWYTILTNQLSGGTGPSGPGAGALTCG